MLVTDANIHYHCAEHITSFDLTKLFHRHNAKKYISCAGETASVRTIVKQIDTETYMNLMKLQYNNRIQIVLMKML